VLLTVMDSAEGLHEVWIVGNCFLFWWFYSIL